MNLHEQVIDSVVVKDIRFEDRHLWHPRQTVQMKVFTFQVVASTYPMRCGLTFEMQLPVQPREMSKRAQAFARLDLAKPLRVRWDDTGAPEVFEALPAVRLEP